MCMVGFLSSNPCLCHSRTDDVVKTFGSALLLWECRQASVNCHNLLSECGAAMRLLSVKSTHNLETCLNKQESTQVFSNNAQRNVPVCEAREELNVRLN